jgi:hypothetical protein
MAQLKSRDGLAVHAAHHDAMAWPTLDGIKAMGLPARHPHDQSLSSKSV